MNLAEKERERVKVMASDLEKIIRERRSTLGPAQSNDGWSNTISKPVLELLRQLADEVIPAGRQVATPWSEALDFLRE